MARNNSRMLAKIIIACVLAGGFYMYFKDKKGASLAANGSKEELKTEIAAILKENPGIVIDAIKEFENIENKKRMEDIEKKISNSKKDLENSATAPFVGNKEAKNVIVEFFDYKCGYCKQAATALNEVVQKDNNVMVVFRDLPILSEQSLEMAKVAAAVYQVDNQKYFDLYNKLFNEGATDANRAKELAVSLGISLEKIHDNMESEFVKSYLNKNRELARTISLPGTPFILINGKPYSGPMNYEEMKKHFQVD